MSTIEQSIEVNVPLQTAYNQWTQFEDFPRFMEGVEEIRQLDDTHLHWVAEVGKFDKAIHHHREHMLDGIVMRTEKGRFFVDAPEIARITNRRVILTIDTGAVAALPAYRSFLGRRFGR